MTLETAIRRFAAASLVLALTACASPAPEVDLLAPTEEQLKLRSFQSRSFDLNDREQTIRAVIAALQDLGFIIERANASLGLVTAARFAEPRYYDVIGVTVTVRPQPGGAMLVRANAIYNNEPVTDPKVYQNFFATLERSLFAERN
jgi:hypothetical protein